MRGVRDILVLMCLLAMVVCLCIGGFTDDTFSGKEIFNSHEDYTLFKEELGKKEVGISELTIASSEPPIVVQFAVDTPQDYDFPYGHRSSGRIWTWRVGSIILPSILGVLAMSYIIWRPRFGEQEGQ